MWSSYTNSNNTTSGSPSPQLSLSPSPSPSAPVVNQFLSPNDTPTPAPLNLGRFRPRRLKPRSTNTYEFDSSAASSASSSPQPHLEIHHSTSVSVSVETSEPGDDSWLQTHPASQTFIIASANHSGGGVFPVESAASSFYSAASSGFAGPTVNKPAATSPLNPASKPRQGHGYQHSFSQTLGVAPSSKTILTPTQQQQQAHDSFVAGGLFINGLSSNPTVKIERVERSKPETDIKSQTAVVQGGQSVSPALRSPGGHFYDRNNQKLFRSPAARENDSFGRTSDLAVPSDVEQHLRLNLGPRLALDTNNIPWRPASSVYSQPSPPISSDSIKTFIYTQPAASTDTTQQEYFTMQTSYDISPLSSPELSVQRRHPTHDVSLLNTSDDLSEQMSRPVRPGQNSVAQERRERKTQQLRERPSRDQMRLGQQEDQSGRQLFRVAQGQGMKWDAMTGEPTFGPGRSAQVKPAEYAQEFSKSPNRGEFVPEQGKSKATSAISKFRNAQANLTGKLKEMRAASQPIQQSPSRTEAPVIDNRPPWKGASGRERTVPPVQDSQPGVKARRKISASAMAGLAENAIGLDLDTDQVVRALGATTSPTSSPGSTTSPRGNAAGRGGTAVPLIRKMAPSKNRSPTSPTNVSQANLGYPTPPSSVDRKPGGYQGHEMSYEEVMQQSPTRKMPADFMSVRSIRRKPTPSTSIVGAVAIASQSTMEKETDLDQPPAWTLPPSRFSVTTVGTSVYDKSPDLNGHDESVSKVPRGFKKEPALEDPVNILPNTGASTNKQIQSRSNRSSADDVLKTPKRKPASPELGTPEMPIRMNLKGAWKPSMARDAIKASSPVREVPQTTTRMVQSLGFTSVNSLIPRSPASAQVFNSDTISIHTSAPGVKALPPAPPEAGANDRVAHLEALLSALANRRININQAITKMTEMMPRDNLLARPEVQRRREEEKEKVKALKEELAEVQREEYELGIKLHRAYKRQEREEEYEGDAGLWVRRVAA